MESSATMRARGITPNCAAERRTRVLIPRASGAAIAQSAALAQRFISVIRRTHTFDQLFRPGIQPTNSVILVDPLKPGGLAPYVIVGGSVLGRIPRTPRLPPAIRCWVPTLGLR